MRALFACLLLARLASARAEPAAEVIPAPAAPPAGAPARPEARTPVQFPTKEQCAEFSARLQAALNNEGLENLAACEPEARAVLAAWQTLPGCEDYVDWLQERLDYMEAARQATRDKTPGRASRPPYYEMWLKRMRTRALPARAEELMPRLREIFIAAGLPPGMAWLAEVESTFNPEARSPLGALGLFQLMPGTARDLGLGSGLTDERADPEKNARAAAKYLKQLHARFGDWSLVLAAYNVGPGRVSRTLAEQHARTFKEIAAELPAETSMYVPKVLATLAVRAGLLPEDLPPPEPP